MNSLARAALLALALFLGPSSSFAQGAGSGPDAAASEPPIETASVVIDGRTLFTLRGISALPAPRRAGIVTSRILELARDPSFDPATIEIAETDLYTRIGPEERPIARIADADADFEGSDRRLLADVYRARVREAIVAYRAARSRSVLLASVRRAGIATVLFVLALLIVRWFIQALRRWLERHYAHRVKTVAIRSFEVLRAEQIWGLLRGTLRLIGVITFVSMVVFYLRYTLGLFPWTSGAASQMDDWILAPLAVLGSGFVAKIPDLIFLAVLAIIVRYLLRVVHLFFFAIGRGQVQFKEFDPSWADPTYKLVRIAIIAFTVIVAYPYIPGSNSDAFKGVSIFIGVLFSLGSSSTISNVLAGYAMIYRRAFREGDVVRIAGLTGVVSRVRLQVTLLRTPKNEEIIIPNSTILAGEVINYSSLAKTDGLILHTTVGIGYETPWRQVEAMLLEAADRTEGIKKEPKPFVLQTALGDFAVTYQINVYCDEPRTMLRVYSALHANILDLFNEYGVQIMTPAYESDPDELKVVPREKWHAPPAKQP
jgi:small-conductance mechanosensitive channel